MATNPDDLKKLNLSKAGLEKQNELIAIEKRLKRQAEERDNAWNEMLAKSAAGDSEGAAKAQEKWEKFREQYKNDLKEVVAGYDTLVAVLNKMMTGILKLCAALRATLPIEWVLGQASSAITSRIGYRTHHARHALSNLLAKPDDKFEIPQLQYFVDMDPKDNTVVVDKLAKNLVRSDGESFTEQQQKDFELNVRGWLETTKAGQYDVVESIVGKDRIWKIRDMADPAAPKELNQEEFRKLRGDPVDGLATFLNRKLQLNMKHLPEDPSVKSAPSPSPK